MKLWEWLSDELTKRTLRELRRKRLQEPWHYEYVPWDKASPEQIVRDIQDAKRRIEDEYRGISHENSPHSHDKNSQENT